jgi:hypothetical protein
LAEQVGDFNFINNDSVLYTTLSNNSVIIQTKDLTTNTTDTIFTTPFREAHILLGTEVAGPHYFFPKTNYQLEGFVYRYQQGQFDRLAIDGFGLAANSVGEQIISSHRDQQNLMSTLYNPTTNEMVSLATPLIPEKCFVVNTDIYCAIPNETLRYDSINHWLQGVSKFSDSLWQVTPEENNLVINITAESGRRVDVIDHTIGTISGDWYFRNKNDNSLWIFELANITDPLE